VPIFFIDEAVIHVRSGKGGDGCVAFRREAHVPRGGPAGGDGGRGGDVVFVADEQLSTLMDHAYRRQYRAGKGRPGGGDNRTGRGGKDLIIPVPVGTVIYDAETGELLGDLVEPGQRLVAAKGGRGGRGNAAFATATDRAPRKSEEGGPAEERRLRLELKILADAGLVGLPNAGKSTLLAAVSRARPKVASYPFTTLDPHLGIVDLDRDRRFVLADLPGLVAGASEGKGLGLRFLKHVERTKVLVHLVTLDPDEQSTAAVERYDALRRELVSYGRGVADKPEIVVLSRMDLPWVAQARKELRGFFAERNRRLVPVSSVLHKGLDRLTEEIWKVLSRM